MTNRGEYCPSMDGQTPEEFCWLYAVGCLESRYHEKTLAHNEYLQALRYIEENMVPSANQVRTWFPKPFEKLEPDGTRCTLKQMQKYWRQTHRSPEENTPVLFGKVTSVTEITDSHVFARIRIITDSEEKENKHDMQTVLGQDLHHLGVTKGDEVYVHASIIAEKIS